MKDRECSSSRVQIKDSGLTCGVDDETSPFFSGLSILLGAVEEMIMKETFSFNSVALCELLHKSSYISVNEDGL